MQQKGLLVLIILSCATGTSHDSPSSFIFLRKSQIRLSRPPVIPDLFPIFTSEI